MGRKKVSFGLSLNSKKCETVEDSGRLSSVITTPITKKSSSLYKDVLKESVGKSLFNSPGLTSRTSPRGDTKKNDEYDFHCSFDSDEENTADVSLPLTQPVSQNLVFQGVVAYVEARSNTENRFQGISKQMELLGAVVVNKFIPEVTHVVFKDGKKSTRDKAMKKGIHLVNVLWVESCRQSGKHVSEDLFPVIVQDEMHTPIVTGRLKRTKSMQPRSFEEDLRHSAEKINRRRRRKEAADKMSPLSKSNGARLPYQDSHTPFSPIIRCQSAGLFIPETPIRSDLQEKHDLGDMSISEKMNLLTSIKKSNKPTNTTSNVASPAHITPTSPKAAPLDMLQTVSGQGKKRKRNKSTREQSPNKSDDNLQDKTTSKKARTTDKEVVDTIAFNEDNIKVSRLNNASNEDDKGNDKDGRATMSTELDVFGFNEEEIPTIKTRRAKKTVLSKSLSKGESSFHSTQEAELQAKARVGARVGTMDLLNEQEVRQQDERNRVKDGALSDSGIYPSEVETNNNKTSTKNNNNKRKYTKKTVSDISSKKDQSESHNVVKHRDVDQLMNPGKHALHNKEKTNRTEESVHQKIKRGVKKNGNRKNGSEEEETTASEEEDKNLLYREGKTQDADITEESLHKTSKKGVNKSGNRNGNKKKKSDVEGDETTGSEGESKQLLYREEKAAIIEASTQKKSKKGVKKNGSRKNRSGGEETDETTGSDEDEKTSSTDCMKERINDQQTDDADSDDYNEDENSRNTTDEFEEKKNKKNKRKKVIKVKKPSRSLVLTSMHFGQQDIVVSVLRKLGGFYVADKVSPNTTHVVSGTTKRTLNVLLAIAQGCWLVSPEWAMKSLEAGYWIDEEPYELADAYPSALLSRLERANTGSDYQQEVFTDVGLIYVCDNTSPPTDALIKLITLCNGEVCTSIRKASVCVGNVNRKTNAVKVSETWVIDSITEHTALPFTSYIIS